ncbi:MAG TPA: enoyl-CoA hydratase-related protein [Actinomycetota bacterium]|nr:enoyl-CoA hydratase-related protein [Actinomycetota bacterium]
MALVGLSLEDRIATLTLDRPEARNALSIGLCNEIVAALESIPAEARVVMVAGSGKVFCSGADFAAVSGPGGIEFLPAFERMLEAVARFRLPTVAAIQGAALGGGLQLATVCDFRIAAADARLGIPSSRLGIVVNFENVQRLVLLAGIAVAKEILMAGWTFTGEEAMGAGLVTRAVGPDVLGEEVRSFASQIAALAPLSVQGVKRAIQVTVDHMSAARAASPERVAEIDALVTAAYGSRDLQEGIAALADKRPPDFKGS